MLEPIREDRALAASSDRAFGWVMVGFFLLIGGGWPMIRGGSPRLWLLGIGAAFALLALLAPRFLGPANRLWMKFSHLVSRIMNPVVMAVIFFGIITPIALLMRMMGKRTLNLSPDPDAASYWTARDPLDASSAERLF